MAKRRFTPVMAFENPVQQRMFDNEAARIRMAKWRQINPKVTLSPPREFKHDEEWRKENRERIANWRKQGKKPKTKTDPDVLSKMLQQAAIVLDNAQNRRSVDNAQNRRPDV